ncbi:peptidyl-prolyl cis-trans isomerase FKBP2-like protein [Dinothrombium tinctorium]|uniref:peptidylprolyl isomerase n=1 Tax=Dinothrombium tinctorium TaxID=1965070 RepID=A0A3S3NFD4_9ACAR|nr:peptidyl-prolyl cis-trans isomerase FKBP2-like protein [Dinothrombium tinctorium]RWS01564.1 peptidyl-prolyl cis-trans isomerase FKBP2-like protein [Dinothrombium tinctorium]RWS01816.1 peptidyl-prolyl cis-trans isomerase FKBP2-like protein [Dinothrombium tinctorium]
MVTHFVLEIICLLIKLNLIVANDNTEADVKIEVLSSVDNCVRKAADNDFLTIHFTSKWKDGLKIATTYERGVPIEIQLGTKMLSPGLDKGLQGMCVGEKRKIQMPANLGWLESSEG